MKIPTNPLTKYDSPSSPSTTKGARQADRLMSAALLAGATLEELSKEKQAGRLVKSARLAEVEELLRSVIKFCNDHMVAEHEPLDEQQQRALCGVMRFRACK
jgi:hypothetical protein